MLLIHQRDNASHWQCMVRGKVRPGMKIIFDHGHATVDEIHDDGERTLTFNQPALQLAEQDGHMPLPPYIKRADTLYRSGSLPDSLGG